MKCEKCNTDLADDNKFCPNCGYKVEKVIPTDSNPADEPAPKAQKSKRLLGFRSNKTWKKLLSVLYLVFWCLMLFASLIEAKEGQITTYDFVINKIFSALMVLMLLSPYIFLSNTKLREKLPLFKKHKAGKSFGGMLIVLVCFFVLIGIVNSMHSEEYKADMENHAYIVVSSTEADCTNDGKIQYHCEYCGTEDIDYIEALGHDMKEISRVDPVGNIDGKITYRCSRCGEETEEGLKANTPSSSNDIEKNTTEKGTENSSSSSKNHLGSKNNPYILDAATWHAEHCAGTTSQKYLNQWVKLTGTVLSISDYDSLKGYYLSGGPGAGLVGWVDDGSLAPQCGQQIVYIGKVSVEDSGKQVEITDGQILSASWPTEKPKSPITISDWTWTRDYVGGVEWNFRFTNNTDKVVKYISMKWNCYNAVGDLVYDEISGEYSHGVKYTGPLNPKETTDYLCNSTRFYSYSYNSAKLSFLQVEFMDGTIIQITDKAYTDIVVKELEEETVFDHSGMRYIVNNVLGTCYVASIGTCTDSYIGILSSLYSDTVTNIGESAFANASFIETVSITTTLESIGDNAFANCTALTKIDFSGTVEQWNAIEKGTDWNYNTGEYVIFCLDGHILKDGRIIYD